MPESLKVSQMRPVDWVQARPAQAAGLLGAVLGTVLGLAWPVVVPPAQTGRGDAWTVPPGLDVARPRESEFAAVRNAPAWGGGSAASGVAKSAVWQLTGIIADPSPAAIVLPEGSSDAKRLRVGDSLPDGGKIEQVLASGVIFARDGCTYERLLYGPAVPAENEPCELGAQAVK